jgi:4-hydroxybenzoate polyprenyltransferase
MNKSVLCIDCDGTLIKTDLLHEAFLLLLKQSPLKLGKLFFWFLKGKSFLKLKLSEAVEFNYSSLPYRGEILDLIKQERKKGRKIALATASPFKWAEGIEEHLNLFDKIIATKDKLNLSGKHKALKLVELYGERGFSYAGNSHVDIHIWRHADAAIVVNPDLKLKRKVEQVTTVSKFINTEHASVFTYLRTLRIYQWLKNLLIFVPMLAGHKFTDSSILMNSIFAFFSIGLCASAGYVINDLLDLESDRMHIRKRNRPFASAAIPIHRGILLFPLLILISLFIVLFLPEKFIIILSLYFCFSIIYSLVLKKFVIVDVLMLAILYTIRIIAGSIATGIAPSFWLLAFSMFIFLSLAIVKRYSELLALHQQNKNNTEGRGYFVSDLSVLMSLGAGSGMASVLVLSLYINNSETSALYPYKYWLWMLPPILLYWVSRLWMKANRGEIHDDPVIFAATDWQSIVLAVLCIFIVFAALKFAYL